MHLCGFSMSRTRIVAQIDNKSLHWMFEFTESISKNYSLKLEKETTEVTKSNLNAFSPCILTTSFQCHIFTVLEYLQGW